MLNWPMTAAAETTKVLTEVAEFETQVPHWFGAAGDQPVEVLSLLSRPGERAQIRAAPRRKNAR